MASDGSTWFSQQRGSQVGLTKDLDPILLDLSMFSSRFLPGEYSRNNSQSPLDEGSLAPPRTTSLAQLQQLIGLWGLRLVEAFEQTVHPTFPICGDDVFATYRTGMADLDPALVAALYLVGRAFVSAEEASDLSLPDAGQLEDAALSLFHASLARPTLSTVHAGVILMQHVGIDTKTLNTQLIGASHELNLHLDCSSWNSSRQETGLRKRLAWAIYMQDKWCSLIHGRPSSISTSNWGVQALVASDFDSGLNLDPERSAKLETGRLIFMQMVSLTLILSTILETFYTLQAVQEVQSAGENGRHLILERAKPIQIRLKQWFSSLPAELKIEHMTPSFLSSSAGYLHLGYFTTEITLHRSIIRGFGLPPFDDTVSASATSSTTATPPMHLRQICRTAAKTRLISALDFTNRLRPTHLHAFWHFSARANFALVASFGALLLATAPGDDEAWFYHHRLGEFRWTLSADRQWAPWLAYAVEAVERLSVLVGGLARRGSDDGSASGAMGGISGLSGMDDMGGMSSMGGIEWD